MLRSRFLKVAGVNAIQTYVTDCCMQSDQPHRMPGGRNVLSVAPVGHHGLHRVDRHILQQLLQAHVVPICNIC